MQFGMAVAGRIAAAVVATGHAAHAYGEQPGSSSRHGAPTCSLAWQWLAVLLPMLRLLAMQHAPTVINYRGIAGVVHTHPVKP